jgi:hypothetical protein
MAVATRGIPSPVLVEPMSTLTALYLADAAFGSP